MKIVMICDFYNETLEYQENLLVRYYTKHGHEVTVITSTFESVFDYYNDRHDNTAQSRTYEDRGAKIIKLAYRYNILNRLRAFTKIDRILETEKPDLIYVHDIMLNFPEAIAYLKRHPACRIIMDYHADYSNSGKNWLSLKVLHGIIRKWFLDRARPYLSRIFPIVPAGSTFLHEIYGIPYSEMEILPLGADTDIATSVRKGPKRASIRAEMGIADEDVVIFTGGKLAPAKKTELLIAAVQNLSDFPLHLVVVGEAGAADAEYKRSLLDLSSRSPNIHFVGWLDPVGIYEYLSAADLAVFPASQSIIWQQAIAMGLPLIVGNTGHQDISYLNLRENIVILDHDNIAIAPLEEAIRNIVCDPSRMHAMSVGAGLVADEHLNWNKLILRTLRFNAAD